ncbi:MAG: DUF1549 domain-containing protein, partial [Planctomycetales bacterium]|nr:DUF1549 domain-containing protein [Planctomycetales bacterium]
MLLPRKRIAFPRTLAVACAIAIVGLGSHSQTVLGDENGTVVAIDFDTQVIPVLTRFGCNSGACHGAAIGRGGFKLSLFGSKPADDHREMVLALEGRRINRHRPAESLLLRKATETMEHGGGERFPDDSNAYSVMKQWIVSGANRIQGRQLVQLNVTPTEILLDDVDRFVAVSVVAEFDDQTEVDVTDLTVLTSDDEESVSIDRKQNRLQVHRRGEHLVLARYLNRVQPIRLGVPFADSNGDQQNLNRPNHQDVGTVDRFVDQKLSQLRIPASNPSDDYEFARRVWLDLTGRLPAIDELNRFARDRSDGKRAGLIDRLLVTDEFANYWALKWANILAIYSKRSQPEGTKVYHECLVHQSRQHNTWTQPA